MTGKPDKERMGQDMKYVIDSFTMKKFQSMEIIYVTFSQITKLHT